MDSFKITIENLDKLENDLINLVKKLKIALELDSKNIAATMEQYAKNNARWTDRTGHARQFIRSNVEWQNTNKLLISISHHVDYGIWLELANEGKYAILEEALNKHLPDFREGWIQILSSL